jgi:hypothetical protein
MAIQRKPSHFGSYSHSDHWEFGLTLLLPESTAGESVIELEGNPLLTQKKGLSQPTHDQVSLGSFRQFHFDLGIRAN